MRAQASASAATVLQVIPLAKVKRMMREHADVKSISADANFVLARATVSYMDAGQSPPQPCSKHTVMLCGSANSG